MDLRNVILNYERTIKIGLNDIYIEEGTVVPVRREHIARDPGAAHNRIVHCEIVDMCKHPYSGRAVFKIRADGYMRTPYISTAQIETRMDDPRESSISRQNVIPSSSSSASSSARDRIQSILNLDRIQSEDYFTTTEADECSRGTDIFEIYDEDDEENNE